MFSTSSRQAKPFASLRDASIFFRSSPPPLSANFADQSPRCTIVPDRRDIVTKLIHRRYNAVGRRRFRLGASRRKGPPHSACRYRSSKEKKKKKKKKRYAETRSRVSMCRRRDYVAREARKNGALINRRNARQRLRDVRCNGTMKGYRCECNSETAIFSNEQN